MGPVEGDRETDGWGSVDVDWVDERSGVHVNGRVVETGGKGGLGFVDMKGV